MKYNVTQWTWKFKLRWNIIVRIDKWIRKDDSSKIACNYNNSNSPNDKGDCNHKWETHPIHNPKYSMKNLPSSPTFSSLPLWKPDWTFSIFFDEELTELWSFFMAIVLSIVYSWFQLKTSETLLLIGHDMRLKMVQMGHVAYFLTLVQNFVVILQFQNMLWKCEGTCFF